MKKILEQEPSNDQARRNIVQLEPLAREKMEKMKEEMMGNDFFVMLSLLHSFIYIGFLCDDFLLHNFVYLLSTIFHGIFQC